MKILNDQCTYLHCKNTWVTLTTFLGCLSCINVTKERYQIGKASLVTLVLEDLAIWLHSWHFYHKPCNQGTQGMQMSKQQHTSPEMLICKFSEKLYILTRKGSTSTTLYSNCKQSFVFYTHTVNATEVTKIWLNFFCSACIPQSVQLNYSEVS